MRLENIMREQIENKEILLWRNYFLDDVIFGSSPYKFIPEEDKDELKILFLSIPSSYFMDPWNEFDKCISALLQAKATKFSC